MKNFRSFSFWTALAGAVTILANALGECFGFSVNNEVITDVILAIAGLLVVLGVVTMPKKETTDTITKEENNEEENDDNQTSEEATQTNENTEISDKENKN